MKSWLSWLVWSAQPSMAAATSEKDQREPTGRSLTFLSTACRISFCSRSAVSRILSSEAAGEGLRIFQTPLIGTFTVAWKLVQLVSGTSLRNSSSGGGICALVLADRAGRRRHLGTAIFDPRRHPQAERQHGGERLRRRLPHPHLVDEVGVAIGDVAALHRAEREAVAGDGRRPVVGRVGIGDDKLVRDASRGEKSGGEQRDGAATHTPLPTSA